MFVDNQELIKIAIYYKKLKNRNTYIAYAEKEFNALKLKEEDKKTYGVLEIGVIDMEWGLYNDLQESAMVESQDGERQWKYNIFKEKKLLAVLKEWNAVDKDNKKIPINMANIRKLAPSIAETILRAYDDISLMDEKNEGK